MGCPADRRPPEMPNKKASAAPLDTAVRQRGLGRRDALTALYEAEFGLRSAREILGRRAASGEVEGEPLAVAEEIGRAHV